MTDRVLSLDTLDESKFHEETLSFPPYWKPELSCSECGVFLEQRQIVCKAHPHATLTGNRFYGTVLTRDVQVRKPPTAEDPEGDIHVRYVLQAACDGIACSKGSGTNLESVLVQNEEFFSVSELAGLPLDRYFGMTVLITTVGKRAARDPKNSPMYLFKLHVDADTKRMLDSKRRQIAEAAFRASLNRSLGTIEHNPELGASNAPALPAAS